MVFREIPVEPVSLRCDLRKAPRTCLPSVLSILRRRHIANSFRASGSLLLVYHCICDISYSTRPDQEILCDLTAQPVPLQTSTLQQGSLIQVPCMSLWLVATSSRLDVFAISSALAASYRHRLPSSPLHFLNTQAEDVAAAPTSSPLLVALCAAGSGLVPHIHVPALPHRGMAILRRFSSRHKAAILQQA